MSFQNSTVEDNVISVNFTTIAYHNNNNKKTIEASIQDAILMEIEIQYPRIVTSVNFVENFDTLWYAVTTDLT